MSRKKLIRVVATIHHEGLAPGETALVDSTDEDVQALLAGGYLIALGKGEEPEQLPDAVGSAGADAAGGTESDPNAPLPAGDPLQAASPSQGGRKPAEGR